MMDLVAKAQIFAIFAIPACIGIGLAEQLKNAHAISRGILYLFGFANAVMAIVLPFIK